MPVSFFISSDSSGGVSKTYVDQKDAADRSYIDSLISGFEGLPAGEYRATLVHDGTRWIATVSGNFSAGEASFSGDVSASRLNSDEIFIQDVHVNNSISADSDMILVTDSDGNRISFITASGFIVRPYGGGGYVEVEHDRITITDLTSSVYLTPNGLVLKDGTTLTSVSGFVYNTDSRLTDARDPMAHCINAHVGMVSTASQVSITPSDYTGNLAGISEDGDPNQRDVNLIIDALELSTTGSGESLPYGMLLPGGKLEVPPATTQIASASNFSVTSENIKVALAWTPEIDYSIDSLSMYIGTVTNGGNLALTLHSNSFTGFESDGNVESWQDPLPFGMTSDTAPSPYVVGMYDYTGASCEHASYPAWRALSSDITQYCNSTVTPSSEQPVYYTLDMGASPAFPINAGAFLNSANAGFPTAWTVWAANGSSMPDVTNDSLWTQIGGSFTATAPSQYYGYPWRAINGTKYRYYRWKITTVSTTNCAFHMHIYKPITIDIPGTQLADLGNISSGSTSASWVRTTFTPQQLTAGQKHWLVSTGTTGINVGLSYNRVNATIGNEQQDGVECLVSQDGGNTWRHTYLNSIKFRCLFNWVVNSNTNHVPRLIYGRHKSKLLPSYETSSWRGKTIPQIGVYLDCDGLIADSGYNIYIYDNSGNITLEASQTLPTTQDGVRVKTGEPNKTFVGMIMPWTYFSGHVGPIDHRSRRCVWNAFHRKRKGFGRTNPYYALSLEYNYATVGDTTIMNNWFKVGSGVWDLYFVNAEGVSITFVGMGGYNDNYGRVILYSLDGNTPQPMSSFNTYTSSLGIPAEQLVDIPPGAHKLQLMSICGSGYGAVFRWFHTAGNASIQQYAIFATVEV